METNSTLDKDFELIKFLYQFKDDNKFYHVDTDVLKNASHEEKHTIMYTLRDKALIATDTEIQAKPAKGNGRYYSEVKARILPKGIVAVEKSL